MVYKHKFLERIINMNVYISGVNSCKSNQDRIFWIEFARGIAILLVVFCHSVESSYNLSIDGIGMLSLKSRIFSLSCFTLGRLGVPIFLMITGYLQLDRKWNQEKCIHFWKKNCFSLFLCTEIWIVIYYLFISLYYGKVIDVNLLLQEMFFLRKSEMPNMWYMPMILGMYILIPMVSCALSHFDIKKLLFPILFFSICCFCVPVVCLIFSNKQYPLSLQLSLGYSGGVYGLYIIFGYLIKRNVFKKISDIKVVLLTLFSFIATVLFQYREYEVGITYNVWYNNVFLMICAVSLMVLLSRIGNIKNKKIINIVRSLSSDSFGIFLIHIIVLKVLERKLIFFCDIHSINLFLLNISVLFLSWLFVELIKKIPIIGKVLFYIR